MPPPYHCHLCNALAPRLCDGCDRPMCLLHCAHSSLYIACRRGKGGGATQGTIDYCADCHAKRSAPPVRSQSPPNHALDWHQGSIAYYQRLIDRYTALGIADRDAGTADPDRQAMRRHEIRRLRSMVAAVNEKVIQLGGN